jgi:hypothetical protein
VSPAVLVGEGPDPLGGRLRDHGEAEPVSEVRRSAVKGVEDRSAGRAWGLGEGQPCRLPARGPRPRVARPAGEHEAVDHERVLPPQEELGEANFVASLVRLLEPVVVGEGSAGW